MHSQEQGACSREASEPLRAAVVGCGRMGRNQARILARMPEYALVAASDISRDAAEQVASDLDGVTPYDDFGRLLTEQQPEVVAVCASNVAHAALTIQAAEAAVRGIYCEKPMATCLGDARAMVDACRERGAVLLVNHQRRTGGDLRTARELIDGGGIGDVGLLRGQCAGDLLSDGTHLVDSLMSLAGDRPAAWVFGQTHRPPPDDAERGMGFTASGGYRFGHPIEQGAMAAVQLDGGPRLELLCGDLRLDGSEYQDYEVVGSSGRLWRKGDRAWPNLFIQDGQHGEWQAIEWDNDGVHPIERGFRDLARLVHEGGEHPLSGDIALRHFEVLMAIYESARLHRKLTLPLEQDRFPLELMIED